MSRLRKRRRALFDVDGIFLDFTSPSALVVEAVTGKPPPADWMEDWDLFRSYDKDTQKKIYDAMKVPNWCFELQPYPGAADFLARVSSKIDVFFVTSPLGGPYWAHERELAIEKHFGFRRWHVISGSAKFVCHGDVFVDDKSSHVEEVHKDWQSRGHHGISIVWDQPYNRTFDWPYRARNWDELEALVLAE